MESAIASVGEALLWVTGGMATAGAVFLVLVGIYGVMRDAVVRPLDSASARREALLTGLVVVGAAGLLGGLIDWLIVTLARALRVGA